MVARKKGRATRKLTPAQKKARAKKGAAATTGPVTTKKKATKKKAVAKKKAPAKNTNWKEGAIEKKKTDPKVLAMAKEVLPAIRSGEITVRSVWRDQLKLDNITPLRNAFIEILGSKKAWNEVLDNRPKKTIGFQKGVPAPKVSDVGVPVVFSSKFSDGWSSTTMDVHLRATDVVTSPEGVNYVRASALEHADLIVDHTKRFKELGRSRWRKIEKSSMEKQAKQEKKLAEEGEKARAAKKAAKKRKATKRTTKRKTT